MRTFLLLAILGGCAPDVPSLAERAHASDLVDQAALERQLVALPGVSSARALLHRAVTDPLAGMTSPSSASVVVTVEHGAPTATIEAAAHRLAPTATIVIAEAPAAPTHRPPVLAIAALVTILGIAGYVAWNTRPRR